MIKERQEGRGETQRGKQRATRGAIETQPQGLRTSGHVRLQLGLATRHSSAPTQGLCAKHPKRCRGSQRNKCSLLHEYSLLSLSEEILIFQTMRQKAMKAKLVPLTDHIFPTPKFRICGPVTDVLWGLQQECMKMSISKKPKVVTSFFKRFL